MSEIPVSQTAANLLHAFARAMLANHHYVAFASSLEAKGQGQAAAVLRGLAQRRADQADGHLRLLAGLEEAVTDGSGGGVSRDICAAIASERDRSAAYAGMARTARDEGFDEIADWFELLAKARRSYVQRLRGALVSQAERGWIGFGR